MAREIVERVMLGERALNYVPGESSQEATERMVAAALTAHATAAVERYALAVDDPAAMHLHYDGCLFAPYADVPRWEMPDPRPDCTCAETHKAAYWKGQWMLERGQREVHATAAVAAERERCALVAESFLACKPIAAEIRRLPEEPRHA